MQATEPIHITLDEERDVVARLQRGDRSAAALLYQWYGEKLYRAVILPRLPNPELGRRRPQGHISAGDGAHSPVQPDRSVHLVLAPQDCSQPGHRRASRPAARTQVPRETRRTGNRRPNHGAPATASRPSPEIAETKDMVDLSLSRMNERYAQALRLRLIEDRDREECADILGVKVGTFDVLLHRACKAFKKVYPP